MSTPTEAAPRPSRSKKAAKPDTNLKKIVEAAATLKMAADPTRFMILVSLTQGPLNVGDIVGRVEGATQPAVSHHLALLRHGRLVLPTRSGKFNQYALTETGKTLADLAARLVG